MKIRYRYNGGTTRRAIKYSLKHIPRLGDIKEVRATRVGWREYITFIGSLGSVRILGFSWGYSGEGPRGLCEVLTKIGVFCKIAEYVSKGCARAHCPGTDWKLRFHDNPYFPVSILHG